MTNENNVLIIMKRKLKLRYPSWFLINTSLKSNLTHPLHKSYVCYYGMFSVNSMLQPHTITGFPPSAADRKIEAELSTPPRVDFTYYVLMRDVAKIRLNVMFRDVEYKATSQV